MRDMKCGVPIIGWGLGLILIFAAFQISEIINIFVVQYFYSSRAYYNIVQIVLFSTVLFVWLVYGNIIYFSDENDCAENEEMQVPLFLMRMFLILGYVFMVYFACLLIVILLVMALVYRQRSNLRGLQDEQVSLIR